MRDVRQQIQQGQGSIQTLMARIPGFQGYASRELRREADKAVRDHLLSRLDQAKVKIEQARQNLSTKLALDALGPVDAAAQQLMIVADKVRYADRGYSGYFDPIKITDATLDQIYTLDASLVEKMDTIIAAADGVLGATQSGDLNAALTAFNAKLNDLSQHLVKREDILRGVV